MARWFQSRAAAEVWRCLSRVSCHVWQGSAFGATTLYLPCVFTALDAKALPLSCASTASVVNTLPMAETVAETALRNRGIAG